MNKYRLKNKEAYYLRSTLFNRIAYDNAPKIGPSTSCRICPNIEPNIYTNIALRPSI